MLDQPVWLDTQLQPTGGARASQRGTGRGSFIEQLNEGLDEGVSYRGRLLVSVATEILDGPDVGPPAVEVESTLPLASVSHAIYNNATTLLQEQQRHTDTHTRLTALSPGQPG